MQQNNTLNKNYQVDKVTKKARKLGNKLICKVHGSLERYFL